MIPQRAKRTPSANAFLEIWMARAIATKMMIIPSEKTAAIPSFCLGARRTIYNRFNGRAITTVSINDQPCAISSRNIGSRGRRLATSMDDALTHDIGEYIYRLDYTFGISFANLKG